MSFKIQIATSCLVLALSSAAAFSEDTVELKDENAKYTMQLGGNIAWNADVDLTGPQSTLVAQSPEGHEPLTVVSAMTYLEKNPMVMLGDEVKKRPPKGFWKVFAKTINAQTSPRAAMRILAGAWLGCHDQTGFARL
ncbi:hypothetical protein [Celeribacter halophilus]|uniref:hypothetical protein n=1 Tax=Celeribacter halophilus TaxID=576117 RepID=UPI003A8C91C8